MTIRRAFAAILLIACCAPTAAQASSEQLSIMMDDDLLVYRDDRVRDDALRRMKGLGVDTVRVTLLWSVVAEKARETKALDKRFRKLGASNPKAYPKANWDRYDRLVRAGRTLGIRIYFNVTGPGPKWGHAVPPKKYKKDAKWWKPKPREFYAFVQAVGKRYSGRYTDENDNRQGIPRVSFWSIWNEPNQGGWLRPQWLNGKPVSPQLYRDLYFFGRRALVSTGHGNDVILAGETAPRNVARRTTTSAMGPRTFIKEMLCGPGAQSAGCSRFAKEGPIQTTGWAHHPYTRSLSPTTREADPESITLANINDLTALLDGLAPTGNIKSGLPIFSTEFGYETKPPDPFAGVTLQQQADFIGLSELITYLNPRILANTQFLLKDVKPNKRFQKGTRNYWMTYQSGLFSSGNTPKPAAQVYPFPFYAAVTSRAPDTGQPIATIFGQLRFRADVLSPTAGDQVQLQFKPADGSSDWTAFGGPIAVTNRVGYFTAEVPVPGAGQIRAVWNGGQSPFSITTAGQRVG